LRYLYQISLLAYYAAVHLASLWNAKARKWLQGRKNWAAGLEAAGLQGAPVIWMHCASAGEFEQGKPLLEALKAAHPGHRILLTFFSPSGFETACGYAPADALAYLPLDTRKNADRFFSIVQPAMAIFVKYEFWFHFLNAAAFRHIPVVFVSAVFRPGQLFFRRWAGFYRQLLHLCRHIFVQDEASRLLLRQWNIHHASVSGDTRFDRVQAIAGAFQPIAAVEPFIGNDPVIVAGSTWPGDEALLAAVGDLPFKWIIAPHEVDAAHIRAMEARFRDTVLFSQLAAGGDGIPPAARVLIIDNVGMLSRLYRYATVTYVGGGFTRDGIHNILEAAVWGKPVLFGPHYAKYREAVDLLACGGAWSVGDAAALRRKLEELSAEATANAAGSLAGAYVARNGGATSRIMHWIQENRLLTSP